MTPVETQAILTTIHGHLEGRSGTINSIGIRAGAAKVVIDYTTFADVFAGQDVDLQGSTLSKTIGAITYLTNAPDSGTYAVPA